MNEALHAMTETGRGLCMFIRIVTAFVSGLYLLSTVALFMLHQLNIDIPVFFNSIPYTEEAYFMRAVMGTAIASSLWQASFIRFLNYVQNHNSRLHDWLTAHFKTEFRRARHD